MGRANLSAFFVWLSATLVSALALAALTFLVPAHYRFHEPFFMNPLANKGAVLRNDAMGEGHFGALRSNGRRHNGIDIAARVGSPVYAAKSGRVIMAGTNGGYGLYAQIFHLDGFNSRYAHLSQIFIKHGEWVERGTLIGLVGKTGNAGHKWIRPHLHFEIRQKEVPINPTGFMKPK